MLRSALALVLMLSLTSCASIPAETTNEELAAELIRIRPWDGRTGFNSGDTRLSYGVDARDEIVRRGKVAVPALVAAWERDDLTGAQRSILRGTLIQLGPKAHAAIPALVAEGVIGQGARVCFVHTGGLAALFAYDKAVSEAMV